MSDTQPTGNSRQSLIKFDGTIPMWGVLVLGLTFAAYTWAEFQDLKTRMMTREIGAIEYRKKVDTLEIQQKEGVVLFGKVSTQLEVVKELLLRLEKQLEPRR